jgi:hypothetical protein
VALLEQLNFGVRFVLVQVNVEFPIRDSRVNIQVSTRNASEEGTVEHFCEYFERQP